VPGDDDTVEFTSGEVATAGAVDTDSTAGAVDTDSTAGAVDTDPAEQELRLLEASFAAVEEAMESLTRITADGGDGAVVVAQIEAVVNPSRFPLEADPAV
jgi:hypothetical protein